MALSAQEVQLAWVWVQYLSAARGKGMNTHDICTSDSLLHTFPDVPRKMRPQITTGFCAVVALVAGVVAVITVAPCTATRLHKHAHKAPARVRALTLEMRGQRALLRALVRTPRLVALKRALLETHTTPSLRRTRGFGGKAGGGRGAGGRGVGGSPPCASADDGPGCCNLALSKCTQAHRKPPGGL